MLFCISSPLIWATCLGTQTGVWKPLDMPLLIKNVLKKENHKTGDSLTIKVSETLMEETTTEDMAN